MGNTPFQVMSQSTIKYTIKVVEQQNAYMLFKNRPSQVVRNGKRRLSSEIAYEEINNILQQSRFLRRHIEVNFDHADVTAARILARIKSE